MKRLVSIMLLTVIVTLFAAANSHHVELSFIFGAPVRMRMVFLLAGVFTAGVISTISFQEWRRAHRRRRDALLVKTAQENAAMKKDLLDGVD